METTSGSRVTTRTTVPLCAHPLYLLVPRPTPINTLTRLRHAFPAGPWPHSTRSQRHNTALVRLVRTLRACSHIPARHALQWAVTGSRRTQSGPASKIKQEGGHSAAAAVRSLTGELANLHIADSHPKQPSTPATTTTRDNTASPQPFAMSLYRTYTYMCTMLATLHICTVSTVLHHHHGP